MPRPRGFTLLELLLVVALVALLGAIVAPRALGWVESARARAALDEIRAQVQAQPALAFHARQPRVVTHVPDDWPLPAGWRIELASLLRWEANGMAAAGRMRIWSGADRLADWVVQAPGGEVRAATAADGPFVASIPGSGGGFADPAATPTALTAGDVAATVLRP